MNVNVAASLLASCLSLAITLGASEPPLHVSILSPGWVTVSNPTQKGVAVVKLGTSHWEFRYDQPVLRPGGTIVAHAGDLTGVAFEDGSSWGDPDVVRLKRLRDQMRADEPVDLRGVQAIWYQTLLRYWRDRHPGQSRPAVAENPDADPGPDGMTIVWFYQSTWSVFGIVNSVPANFTIDECVNKALHFSWLPPGYLQGSFTAQCPGNNYYGRTSIGGSTSVMDFCPPGTPGGSASMAIDVAEQYGLNGFGGECYQEWGGGAVASFNINGTTFYGIVNDSCNYPKPQETGMGQGGGCQN